MPERICDFEFKNKGRHGFASGGDTHAEKCSMRYDDVVTIENIFKAWDDFVKGKRKRGDVNEFAIHLSDNLFDILYDLKNNTYVHRDYEEYIICDPKKRVIHKASVRDRVVHRLLYNVLYAYFDKRYIYDSYSCRVGKGTHKAYARFRSFVNRVSKNYTKPCYLLKFDIKKCFESIHPGTLKSLLTGHIEDPQLRNFIFAIIDSFPIGLPLGNLTSQLFINVYLHELDCYAKQIIKCPYYLRYADDIVIVASTREELERVYRHLECFLKQDLDLTTHKKVISSIYAGIDVLGLVFFQKYERLRRSTEKRKKEREKQKSEYVYNKLLILL